MIRKTMIKPEARLRRDWVKIFNMMPGMLAHERIENMADNGTPDYAYCVDGINGWVEFKVHKEPKDHSKKVSKIRHWTSVQRAWMQKRYTSPTVLLILRMGDWDFILDTHNMFSFEERPYSYWMLNHSWKINNKGGDVWNTMSLEGLRNKLKGQCYIEQNTERDNKEIIDVY